ncbi:hypothetical protein EXIGLDRAFT_226383 [Exidia glandulosa HHB12029]|uniref:Secreted protein n=1 Tax=Exidia glandulosa HHB12029 TaxID=1314781 RepID=A0A165E971_EXIGL|nr:hypothetical protein EXIGLDRAFT_226383 [Exidia glandulosa HHB12029]
MVNRSFLHHTVIVLFSAFHAASSVSNAFFSTGASKLPSFLRPRTISAQMAKRRSLGISLPFSLVVASSENSVLGVTYGVPSCQV